MSYVPDSSFINSNQLNVQHRGFIGPNSAGNPQHYHQPNPASQSYRINQYQQSQFQSQAQQQPQQPVVPRYQPGYGEQSFNPYIKPNPTQPLISYDNYSSMYPNPNLAELAPMDQYPEMYPPSSQAVAQSDYPNSQFGHAHPSHQQQLPPLTPFAPVSQNHVAPVSPNPVVTELEPIDQHPQMYPPTQQARDQSLGTYKPLLKSETHECPKCPECPECPPAPRCTMGRFIDESPMVFWMNIVMYVILVGIIILLSVLYSQKGCESELGFSD